MNNTPKLVYLPGTETNITVTRESRVQIPPLARMHSRRNKAVEFVAYMVIIAAFVGGCFGFFAVLDWIVK